ncbi:MAG: hypothetical protein ACREWE_03680 [Gammaproteobacteria bacterium]
MDVDAVYFTYNGIVFLVLLVTAPNAVQCRVEARLVVDRCNAEKPWEVSASVPPTETLYL